MRYSFALLAAVAAAAPQVQPISQISDGQIQAPPATQPAASYPVATSSAPAAISSAVAPSQASSVVAPPLVTSVAATATPVAPVPMPSGSIVPSVNSTVPAAGTGASRTPTAPTSATSSGIPQSTGAAVANMVSFGGLALAAVGAAFFA
ncbi:hypothetical protein BDU57DRAFT_582537 [Ampelomyces quisqualis]|uniref:Uncharacterized protein n=1 Tax=Ampelomyces quisqualis TaxID=50730 RepID=A0A6A5QAG5_AMPQU|nr:hypothetical protein BDU57DRAFT_582537 [Ampelomyces quisqualis]